MLVQSGSKQKQPKHLYSLILKTNWCITFEYNPRTLYKML